MARWMCESCGAALPGVSEPVTSRHAQFVTHEIKPVPWTPHKYGMSAPSPSLISSRGTPHGCMAWISTAALVIGLIAFFGWHDDAYCQRNPDAGPGMRVDRPCYEILAESSVWRAVLGDLGGWLVLGSIVGFCIALWWYGRPRLRKR